MEAVDCVVVGAGAVGLAIGRALAGSGFGVLIAEQETTIGAGVSSRNSEVIHAGIYYPAGSLKARLCVEGRRKLYAYCKARGVPFRQCGKLIVAATPNQLTMLGELLAAGEENGVEGLELIDAAAAIALEPSLQCAGALLSPVTGIFDSHAYMLALAADAEQEGAVLALGSRIERAEVVAGGVSLVTGPAPQDRLLAQMLVNAAGLGAQALARKIDGFPAAAVPDLYLAKGNYFTLSGASPFSRLIYPVPEPGGLGVHLTLDLAGRMRFGPDVEWVDAVDYHVDPRRADAFYRAIRAYWPGLPDGALAPDYAGIRPKISEPGRPAADFIISGPQAHGVGSVVNLFGVESPGLTASLAIADAVAEIVRRQLRG